MEDYTIFEEGTLPSLGKIYAGKNVNPNFRIRSMTTNEEMRRLSHSERPLKVICEIIDTCLINNPFDGFSSYDMCLGDYQYLLHKLRVATYGSSYKMSTYCPICGSHEIQNIDIDNMEVLTYTEDVNDFLSVKLPKSGDEVSLRFQTPRMIDDIEIKKKEFSKKFPDAKSDPSILYTLCSVIASVNGEHLDSFQLENYLRKLPMRDTNAIAKRADKLVNSIGTQTEFTFTCGVCGNDYRSPFLVTSEFYGPTED